MITNTDYILLWKSKGLSTKSIKPRTTSDNSLRVKLTGICLKQTNKLTYTHGKVVNI